MGFFSYNTCDTQKSIANNYSTRNTFTVHLITEDGQVFTEKDYSGYGDFADKDIFSLTSQLNGFVGTEDEAREHFFKNITKRGFISPDGKEYLYGKDFANYESSIPELGGKTPNQLIEGGCEKVELFDFADLATAGYKVPKIVENLPNKKDWVDVFATLPHLEGCELQGFFYPEDEDEDL
jgi:hypothetical protein